MWEVMFAQDTSKLVFGGAPPSVYGTDLRGEYFEYRHKLFLDENLIPKKQSIDGDILEGGRNLTGLEGRLMCLM